MNSGNHLMLVGDLVVWFYEYLGGIKSDPQNPGFKNVLMKPTLVGDLKFAKATHHSPYGWITSEWHRDGSKFTWDVTVPANSTATAWVPSKSAEAVIEGGKPVSDAKFDNGATQVHLDSGHYHFESELPSQTPAPATQP